MSRASTDTWSSVRQITLGGEVVDQEILSALKSVAPHARLTHIYASTELGVCLTVSDGLAGFPIEWLDDKNRRILLQVKNNELLVSRSKASKTPKADLIEWISTGDVVEIKEGRVHFKGRRTDIVNIGGAKVLPSDVEARLMEVPGVVGACVSGRPSSISGMVLTADILAERDANKVVLQKQLTIHCRAHLPSYSVPRMIKFVDSLPMTASGKTQRGE